MSDTLGTSGSPWGETRASKGSSTLSPDVSERRYTIEDYADGESIVYTGLRGTFVPLPWHWWDGEMLRFEFRPL